MTAASIAHLDQRATDLVTVPRGTIEQSWMDVEAITFEVRRGVAQAYVDVVRGRDPKVALFDADRRLGRLNEYARRHAAEAAGITYISPDQLPLFDGCAPDGRSA